MDLCARVVKVVCETDAENVFFWQFLVFAGLDLLYWVTSLSTVHPRCKRPALNLDGSICNAVSAESMKQERDEGMGCCGYKIMRYNWQ